MLLVTAVSAASAAEDEELPGTSAPPATDPQLTPDPDKPFSKDTSSDIDAGNVKPIELAIGQRMDYSSTAILAFSADDTILNVQRKNDTQITLTGLQAGTTQVVFSDNGVLSHITVVVSTTVSASALLMTPQFNAYAPFLLFEFINSSSFTDQKFFESPSYTYNGTLESPFIGATRFRASSSYTQQSDGSKLVPNGTMNIIGPSVDFLFGALDAAIGRQTNAIIAAVPGFGPRFRFLNPFIKNRIIMENLTLFAGIAPQENLMDIQQGQRKAGFNYQVSKNVRNLVFQNFLNVGFVAYQPPESTSYHYTGILEATGAVSKKVQLGGGAYASGKKIGILLTPIYQTPSDLAQLNLRYVQKGLEQVGGQIATSDQHNYTANLRKIFKDRISTLSASASHQIILPQDPSLVPAATTTDGTTTDNTTSGSNTTNVNVSIFRQYSIAQRYGGGYGFSRSISDGNESLSNVLTAYFVHPIGKQSFMQHTLSANQANSNTSATTRQFSLNDQFQYENLSQRHQLGLTSTFTDTPNPLFGFVVNAIANFFSTFYTFQWNTSYSNSDVTKTSQQVSFGPNLLFMPTTTQVLSVSSNATYNINPSGDTFNGSFNITYRRYMGPGVVRDSLFKRIFKTASTVRISGRVYQDVNFNNKFEEGDLGLTNVPISIDGKSQTISGPGGIFTMANITPGQHTITVGISPIQNINKPMNFPVYISADSTKKEIGLPVQEPRATITVRAILDSDDSKSASESDRITGVRLVEVKQGNRVKSLSATDGGAIFNGIDIGTATVSINPLDIVDGIESISPLVQTVKIDNYSEYVVNFLFKASRGLRGRVTMDNNIPAHVIVKLGSSSTTTDAEGYYWIKNLKEGTFDLSVSGVPKGYCIQGAVLGSVEVTSPFSAERNIHLTTQCGEVTKEAQPTPSPK